MPLLPWGRKYFFGKTKILKNEFRCEGGPVDNTTSVRVAGEMVEILPIDASTMYLGRDLTFSEFHTKELQHRIHKAWKEFALHKKTLCDKTAILSHWLKLFAATVTPTVLYGSCSWTLTEEMAQSLQSSQRKML